MTRINYPAMVGETKTNKKDQKYKILEYKGKNNNKHYFDIIFLETNNLEFVTYNQIKAQTSYDTKALALEKSIKTTQKLKARKRQIKTSKSKYDLSLVNENKRILSIDLATRKVGVTYKDKKSIKSYLLEAKDDNYLERINSICNSICKFVDEKDVQVVILEDVYLGLNSSILVKLVEARAFLLRELMKRDIDFLLIPPIKWKSYFSSLKGLKRAESKRESIRLCNKYKEIITNNDDIADSYLLLKFCLENTK